METGDQLNQIHTCLVMRLKCSYEVDFHTQHSLKDSAVSKSTRVTLICLTSLFYLRLILSSDMPLKELE